MVDLGTWNRLSPEEQTEFNRLHERFVEAVHSTGISDGATFAGQYRVERFGKAFRVTNGTDCLEEIESPYEAAIRALLADACQNLGR